MEALLDYLKQLCIEHKEFNHDDTGTKAYFEFDYKSMTDSKKRNTYVLFVGKLKGRYNDNRGDYKTDQAFVVVNFVQKMKSTDLTQSRSRILKCKSLMDEFLARIEHDRRNGEPAICKLLKFVDFNDVSWEQLEITEDLWTGVELRLPFRYEWTTEYNSERWNEAP